MDPILIIAIVLAAIGGVVFFVMRRGDKPQLPSGEADKKLPSTTETAADADATKKKKKAEGKPEKKKPDADGEKRPAAKEGADEEPGDDAAEEDADEAAEADTDDRAAARKEDVAALKKGLKSTRGGFIKRLAKLFGRKKEIDPALLDEIEEVLITADIGVGTTQKILDNLREQLERNELSDEDRVWDAIRAEAEAILAGSTGELSLKKSPTLLLVVGVNGVGKTTTIGKLASKLKDEGKKVMLAAGDTFRAAAVLQLEVWGRRVGCDVVKGKERADPSSVIFDAIKRAQEEEADVVIADTAGRLHTKAPLMEELKKVYRTAEKALGRPADEVILVLDSTNGQNAIQQAQMFRDALPVSGIVLTKLDGTAKGGVILGIVDEHGIPVRFIGIGERVEDLREFEPASFVEALFEKPDDESLAA